jgi:hypothetical protein
MRNRLAFTFTLTVLLVTGLLIAGVSFSNGSGDSPRVQLERKVLNDEVRLIPELREVFVDPNTLLAKNNTWASCQPDNSCDVGNHGMTQVAHLDPTHTIITWK